MTLPLTCNPDRTRDTPEVCVYCHEVFRRPAAYITHQYKRHFRETDEIKVAFTKAIVQRLRDESESELNVALQIISVNAEKGERSNSTSKLPTKSLADTRAEDNTPDTQPQLGTLAIGIKGSVVNGYDRGSPDPSCRVSAPVAPGKRPWLEIVQLPEANRTRKRKCLELHREEPAVFAIEQNKPGAEPVAHLVRRSTCDDSPSESPISQYQCAPSEGDTRKSGQDGQNDLINRVTQAARASFPYTAEGKTATLKEQISSAVLAKHPHKMATLQQLFRQRTPEDIEDLHRTMFESGVGVDRRNMQVVLGQLWEYLQRSQTYISEEELQLSRSTCMSVEVDLDGDMVLNIKLGRLEGARLLKDWGIVAHFRYVR